MKVRNIKNEYDKVLHSKWVLVGATNATAASVMSPLGSGAGSALNPVLLSCAGVATLVATLISLGSIYLHLKNYRKNVLQRSVVRPMECERIFKLSQNGH